MSALLTINLSGAPRPRRDPFRLLVGDALEQLRTLETESVQCCVTSPPYWGLRDYGVDGQIGQEPTITEYVARLVDIFREVRRVLELDGSLWLNLGDSYAGARGGGHPDPETLTDGDDGSPTADPRRLSPEFVEALMGFQAGWTICGWTGSDASEMP